jgi:molecular chaperone GrpE
MENPREKPPAEAIEFVKEETAAENGPPVAGPAPAATGEAATEIENLKKEKAEIYDRLLRKQAELDNFRKRLQREKEEFLQHATADLIRALLPVLDGFDRALAHRDASSPEQFAQGVEMIRRELLDTLQRAGVTPIETRGKTFDPHFHQAVETVESPDHDDQEIVEELQRGYRLRNRLLRPAIVKVAVATKK